MNQTSMKKILLLLALTITPALVSADDQTDEPLSVFRQVTAPEVTIGDIPTVVELPVSEQASLSSNFLVRERQTGDYIGSHYISGAVDYVSQNAKIITPSIYSPASNMVDGNISTYTEFQLPDEGVGETDIKITTSVPIKTSRLQMSLAQYVAKPLTVEVRAGSDYGLQTIVAEKKMSSLNMTFPEVTASVFEVTLTYGQPLRITTLNFQEQSAKSGQEYLRWLAQPGMDYEVYSMPDRSINTDLRESGSLYSNEGVLRLDSSQATINPFYVPADYDHDGVTDVNDNCVRVSNVDQKDVDSNGRGDACDDFDKDGLINSEDNCFYIPNHRQSDTDGDGIGDECDEEESRITERNPWIPWIGMGTAFLIVMLLFIIVAKNTREETDQK